MEKEGVREKISRWPRLTRTAGMVHQGVSVETAAALEWRRGSEPAERLRWYHDNEKATKSPQDMVRESASFQADGGAGWAETNGHATKGRMAGSDVRQRRGKGWRSGGGATESDGGKERPEIQSARRARVSSRVFRVAAIGASLSFLQRWSFLQKGHTPLRGAKPFWALGRR